MKKSTALAHPNLAFVKYWGKRDEERRLPTAGSISMTLGGLRVRTTVEFDDSLEGDEIALDGEAAVDRERERVVTFLDRLRRRAGVDRPARVASVSNFPRGTGLASSAAGFAALAVAGAGAAGIDASPEELAVLARFGSGSATRSIHGGFVEWKVGERPDGADSHGVPIASARHWPELRLLAAVVRSRPKECSSTSGMRRSLATSPFHAPWTATLAEDLERVRGAILDRDLRTLGEVAESNAVRMHAVCLGARPPLLYWEPGTVEILHFVREIREGGLPVYASIDAGSNVFVLCEADRAGEVAGGLGSIAAVERVVETHPGDDARLVDDPLF